MLVSMDLPPLIAGHAGAVAEMRNHDTIRRIIAKLGARSTRRKAVKPIALDAFPRAAPWEAEGCARRPANRRERSYRNTPLGAGSENARWPTV